MINKFDSLTFGHGQVAQLRFVREDGGWHRDIREPGSDVSDLPEEVQQQLRDTWSPEVVAARSEVLAKMPLVPVQIPTRDRLANIEAAVAALKKAGVLTDEMIDAEKKSEVDAGIKSAGVSKLRKA